MADSSVECYAGRHYPDRPTAFRWQGKRLEVEEVERSWRTQEIGYDSPIVYHFQVRTAAGHFHLQYDSKKDSWQVAMVPPSRDKEQDRGI